MLSFFKDFDAAQADELAREKGDINLIDNINEKIYYNARNGYSSTHYKLWCNEDTLDEIGSDLAGRDFKVAAAEEYGNGYELTIGW